MSHRLLALLLSPALAVTLPAGCGGSSDTDASGGTSTGGAATGGSSGTGSSSGSGGSSADGGDFLKCFDATGKLTAYDLKTCTGATCTLLVHQTDCCGNTLLIGVDTSHLAELQACETAWRTTLPACGCPAGPPEIEQPAGTTVSDASAASVSCGNFTNTSGICITQPK
ncbi:MAG: hypothetical protein IPI67_21270 [Myxococcales bacterium]|nr:hypothetical protein [Myxococcales bacterium]